MAVFAINGRRVGSVAEIRETCFEIERGRDAGGSICLKAEIVFTVEPETGVTLVCGREEIGRYRCPDHSSPG